MQGIDSDSCQSRSRLPGSPAKRRKSLDMDYMQKEISGSVFATDSNSNSEGDADSEDEPSENEGPDGAHRSKNKWRSSSHTLWQQWSTVLSIKVLRLPSYVDLHLQTNLLADAKALLNEPRQLDDLPERHTFQNNGKSLFGLFLYTKHVSRRAELDHVRWLFALLSTFDFVCEHVGSYNRFTTRLLDKVRYAFLEYRQKDDRARGELQETTPEEVNRTINEYFKFGKKLDHLARLFGIGAILVLADKLSHHL